MEANTSLYPNASSNPRVHAQGAAKSLQDVEKAADKALGKAEQKLDKLTSKLTSSGPESWR